MSDNVRVRITCRQQLNFSEVIELTKAEWEKLKKTPADKMEDGDMSPIAGLIDCNDPSGWGDFSDVEMFAVDEGGKEIRPYDSYEPQNNY